MLGQIKFRLEILQECFIVILKNSCLYMENTADTRRRCLQEFFSEMLIKNRLGKKQIRSDICLGAVVREFVLAFLGVHNVTALGNLITWQKVDYDFNYHQMEFPCNINVLITSEGRSLLPVKRVFLNLGNHYSW